VRRISPSTEQPIPPKDPQPFLDKEKFDKPQSKRPSSQ
jgi:hypothetical protein